MNTASRVAGQQIISAPESVACSKIDRALDRIESGFYDQSIVLDRVVSAILNDCRGMDWRGVTPPDQLNEK
ncbi:MAG: hypothetical protein AAGG38_02825 [Planctomycetota bacterium]